MWDLRGWKSLVGFERNQCRTKKWERCVNAGCTHRMGIKQEVGDSNRSLHYQRLEDKHASCFLSPLSPFKTAKRKWLIVTGKLLLYQSLSITAGKNRSKQLKVVKLVFETLRPTCNALPAQTSSSWDQIMALKTSYEPLGSTLNQLPLEAGFRWIVQKDCILSSISFDLTFSNILWGLQI